MTTKSFDLVGYAIKILLILIKIAVVQAKTVKIRLQSQLLSQGSKHILNNFVSF
jgi:hypothetical protein